LYSDQAIKKVAKPPNPLNKATISGIDVIFTLSAIVDPIMAPIAIALIRNNGFTTSTIVTNTAINIAKEDKKLPLTAVSSLPSILMPEIKRIEAIMYTMF